MTLNLTGPLTYDTSAYDTGVPYDCEQPVLPTPDGMVPVIVTTRDNGIVFGYVRVSDVGTTNLKVYRARAMYEWLVDGGVSDTMEVGPIIKHSKVGARMDLNFTDVRMVVQIDNDSCRERWEKAYWSYENPK